MTKSSKRRIDDLDLRFGLTMPPKRFHAMVLGCGKGSFQPNEAANV
jgi:hypothetical protein